EGPVFGPELWPCDGIGRLQGKDQRTGREGDGSPPVLRESGASRLSRLVAVFAHGASSSLPVSSRRRNHVGREARVRAGPRTLAHWTAPEGHDTLARSAAPGAGVEPLRGCVRRERRRAAALPIPLRDRQCRPGGAGRTLARAPAAVLERDR